MAPTTTVSVLPGQVFGSLTVLEECRYQQSRRTRRGARVECVCGSQKVLPLHALTSGNTTSCGCLNFREKQVWSERLWVVLPSGCWEWIGRLNADGYAMFSGNVRVARKVLEEKLGRSLLPGEVARHTCDNPPCVNPADLIPGTQSDNVRDAVERGRKFKLHVGDMCSRGHLLEGSNVLFRTDAPGCIRCRFCTYHRLSRNDG